MKNIIIASVIALALVAGATIYVANKPESCSGSCQSLGSLESADIATSTTSAIAGTHQVLKASAGVLSSVIVASSSAATIEFWNATSTTDSASTSIMKLKASVAEASYYVNAEFPRGIIINPDTGFNGQYTVTWR